MHLVDGTWELFRCWHGAPPANDAEGRPIGAARALLWTLTKLLRGADHAVVVFDAMARPRASARRADVPTDQGPLAVAVSRALGLPTWTAARGQADDVIASAALRFREEARVVLCTSDKDLLQCVVGERVVHWDRARDRRTAEADVVARFGVVPGRIPDLHALIGDPSDGLPGVPGWGPKGAAAVLAAHGGVEDIPERAADWRVRPRGAERMAEALAALRDDVRVVRDLATLRTDLPIALPVAATRWRGPRPELLALAERLGATEALAKLPHPAP